MSEWGQASLGTLVNTGTVWLLKTHLIYFMFEVLLWMLCFLILISHKFYLSFVNPITCLYLYVGRIPCCLLLRVSTKFSRTAKRGSGSRVACGILRKDIKKYLRIVNVNTRSIDKYRGAVGLTSNEAGIYFSSLKSPKMPIPTLPSISKSGAWVSKERRRSSGP